MQNQSTAANRKDLVSDHQKRQVTAKELARLEKQRKLAQTLRLKEEAEENGEDLERKKAWEWSIEQDERWKKKMDEREERSDNRYHSMSLTLPRAAVHRQRPQSAGEECTGRGLRLLCGVSGARRNVTNG